MKILIVSDTHGNHRDYNKVLEREGKFDMLLHLGDTEGGEYYIESTSGCPCHMVAGNNDFFSELPQEELVEIGKYKVFLTHGHGYSVSRDTVRLKREGQERGAQIVMYGHTHRPDIDLTDEIIAINPGSLSYPRQMGRDRTYVVMEIDESGEAKFELKFV